MYNQLCIKQWKIAAAATNADQMVSVLLVLTTSLYCLWSVCGLDFHELTFQNKP